MAFIQNFEKGPLSASRHREGMPCYTGVATGSILPSRFVALDRSQAGHVMQAVSGDVLYGISQAELRGAPDNPSLAPVETRAAADGENCFVFGPDATDVPLMYGGNVAIGDRLTTDDEGRGIKATGSNEWIMAVAQQRGFEGQIRLVSVISPQRNKG